MSPIHCTSKMLEEWTNDDMYKDLAKQQAEQKIISSNLLCVGSQKGNK